LIHAGTSQVALKSSGFYVAWIYSLSRRPQLAAIQPPLQKDDSTLRSRTLLSSCIRWASGSAVEPWTPGRADVGPARPFRHRSYVPLLLANGYLRPLADSLHRTRPSSTASSAGIQKEEAFNYHSLTPCGPDNRP